MIAWFFKKNKYLPSLLLFFITLIIYNLNSYYVGSADTTPNILLPISLIKEGNFDFNEFYNREINNNQLPYLFREVNGKIISSYPTMPGILNLPVFVISFILGFNIDAYYLELSKISSSIIVSLAVLFFYLTLKQILNKPKNALFFTIIFALATNVWALASQGIWQHGPALLFVNLSLFFLFNKSEKNRPWAGLFLGLTIINRPVNSLIALPLLVYIFFIQPKIKWKTLILFTLPLIFIAIYSLYYWGNIFSVGQKFFADGGSFNGNLVTGLAGILVSPSRGLFIYTPLFIFSFIYLFYQLFSSRSLPIYKYFAIIVILVLLLYGKFSAWWGGCIFYGYRYLIDLIPFLVIFLAKFWEEQLNNKKSLKVILIILFFFSVYVQLIGAFFPPLLYPEKNCETNFRSQARWDLKRSDLILSTIEFKKRLMNF